MYNSSLTLENLKVYFNGADETKKYNSDIQMSMLSVKWEINKVVDENWEYSLLDTGDCRLQPGASLWQPRGVQLISVTAAQWWWHQGAPIGAEEDSQNQ